MTLKYNNLLAKKQLKPFSLKKRLSSKKDRSMKGAAAMRIPTLSSSRRKLSYKNTAKTDSALRKLRLSLKGRSRKDKSHKSPLKKSKGHSKSKSLLKRSRRFSRKL